MHVSKTQAAVLNSVLNEIPENAEVVSSEGISANFSSRRYAFVYPHNTFIPARTRHVWFVMTPTIGIEFGALPIDVVISKLAKTANMKLVVARSGVYAFLWSPHHQHGLSLRSAPTSIPALVAVGTAGLPEDSGPTSDWSVRSSGTEGYVVSGDYWPEFKGKYIATVSLTNSTPVRIEVWNSTENKLLAREDLATNSRRVTLEIPYTLSKITPQKGAFDGIWPFVSKWPSAPRGDEIEIRVWEPLGGSTKVFDFAMRKLPT